MQIFYQTDLTDAEFEPSVFIRAKTQDNKTVSENLRKEVAKFVEESLKNQHGDLKPESRSYAEQEAVNPTENSEVLPFKWMENPKAATSLYLFSLFLDRVNNVGQRNLLFHSVADKIKEDSLSDSFLQHMSNGLMCSQDNLDDVYKDKTLDEMKEGFSTISAIYKAYKFSIDENVKIRAVIWFLLLQ